jgi:hypothetical protein
MEFDVPFDGEYCHYCEEEERQDFQLPVVARETALTAIPIAVSHPPRRRTSMLLLAIVIAGAVAVGVVIGGKMLSPLQVRIEETPETETQPDDGSSVLVDEKRAERIREACYDSIRRFLRFDPEFIREGEFISEGFAHGEVRVFNGFNAATRADWSATFNAQMSFESLRVGGFRIYQDGDLVMEGEIDYSE